MSAHPPELGPREQRLLLSCGRVDLDSGRASAVEELLAESLDWGAILRYSKVHSVAPLLHRHLGRLPDSDLVPAPARRRLLELAHRAGYRNQIYARENAGVVASLGAAGIPLIIQKGIVVGEHVYGDLSLRQLIDLVFIVSPEQMEAAGVELGRHGYRHLPVRPIHAVYQWICGKTWLIKDVGLPVVVMMQTEFVDNPRRHRFSVDGVWSRARPATVTGERALVLDPIDLVLYLCLQVDKHGYFNRAALDVLEPADLMFSNWSNNRLVRFVDVNEAIRHHRRELDWDQLVARARSCGVEDAAYASLWLTDRLLGPSVPEGVLEALPGPRPRPRLRRGLMRVVAQPAPRLSPSGLVASALEGLGPRRRKELFRGTVGLLEVAFPGLPALRAEHPGRSTPKLLAISARQATIAISRSAWLFAGAGVRRWRTRGQPSPAWPRSRSKDPDGRRGLRHEVATPPPSEPAR